jgi:hypothetical protein
MTIKKHHFIVDIFVLHLIDTAEVMVHLIKGNNKITELRTILQRESQNS